MAYKVILWGMGKTYNTVVDRIKVLEEYGEIEVVGITANVIPAFSYLDGYPVIERNELLNLAFDHIIVMSDRFFSDIVKTITLELGFEREQIIPYRVIQIPYFSYTKYIELKNKKVSIISNNCWGGMLYRTLGMECRSPFKNVSLVDKDYLKVIKDLPRYLDTEPVWNGKAAVDPNSGASIPWLEWGDVIIAANHYSDAELAIRDWNRRRKKINPDALFVEMYTTSKESEEEFYRCTGEYWRRICFVPYDSDHDRSITLTFDAGQKSFWQPVNKNADYGGMSYKLLELFDEGTGFDRRIAPDGKPRLGEIRESIGHVYISRPETDYSSRKYQFYEEVRELHHAGSKAIIDIYRILDDMGYERLGTRYCEDNLKEGDRRRIRSEEDWSEICDNIPAGSILITQHPYYVSQNGREKCFRKIKKEKNVKIISIVHDIEDLRYGKSDDYLLHEKSLMLELADVLIVHNKEMRSYFVENGYDERKIICLEIFDYITENEIPDRDRPSGDVIYAGNLGSDRASFVYEMSDFLNGKVHMYGPGYDGDRISGSREYHGVFAPDKLPGRLENGFGLVWAGDDINGCSGKVGEYLKYTNPHKLSLYLSAGLPVIIWKEAAEAGFVSDNDLGLVVKDLKEAAERLNGISPGEWRQYTKNAALIGNRLRSGEYTKTAIKLAEKMIENE